MSNEIQIFKNNEFGQVRTLIVDDKPYFVGKDVAEILGYARPTKAIQDHCKGVLKWDIGVTTGLKADGTPAYQNVKMSIIPEGDLYRLIIKSKLPKAQKFEEWVMDEVLPTIRKHGAYMSNEVIEETLNNPDFIIGLATKLKEEKQKNELQLQLLNKQQPKVVIADRFTSCKGFIDIKSFVKMLDIPHMGRSNFFKWLRGNGILMRDNIPYQRYSDHFKVINVIGKDGRWHKQTVMKYKGIEYIVKRLIKDGYIEKIDYKKIINKFDKDFSNVA